MSINGNLGMMLFSGDMSGAQSVGGLQGMANGMTGDSEGSVFQQLLTQMLAGNNVPTDGTGTGGTSAAQGKSEDTGGNLLSALLFSGGNTAKARLLNTVKSLGESMDSKGQPGESKAAKESGSAMEMLQAMMAGLNGTVSAANMEKILAEIQNGTSAAEAISAVGSVVAGTGSPEISGTQQNDPGAQAGILTGAAAAEVMKTAQSGTAVLKGAASAVLTEIENTASAASGTEPSASVKPAKPAGSQEVDFFGKTGSDATTVTEDKTGIPAELQQQEITMTASNDGKQAAVAGTPEKDSSAQAENEKTKHAAEADGMNPDRIGLQNSIQGTVTASGTAETNPQAQQVQAPEQYSQIKDEILAKLEQNGPTEFRMQLEPEDLGQIDIKLKLSEGKLVIDILAANSKTQALLTSQVDKLISSIGLQNVQVESVQVSQQMNSQMQDSSQSQGFNMNSAMDFSQRRQQEQYQQQVFQNANPAGTFSLQQDETQADTRVNRIGTTRYDTHRMNYTV